MLVTDIKAVYICPDHNEKYHNRKEHMETLLKTVGFTQIEHYKSGTENYPECLMEANMNILKNNLDIPVIIFEDDIEWNGIKEIEFKPEYDAIYLGLSKSAGHPTENHSNGDSEFTELSKTQVRVINMLSLHAKLIISRKYKEAIIDIFEKNKNKKYYNDVLISRIQKDFFIVAEKKPLFFQSDKFNEYEIESRTNFIIE